jgi:hypothetical protein
LIFFGFGAVPSNATLPEIDAVSAADAALTPSHPNATHKTNLSIFIGVSSGLPSL